MTFNSEQTRTRSGAWHRIALSLAVALPVLFALGAWLAIRAYRAADGQGTGGIPVADHRAEPIAEDRPAPHFELPTLQGGGTISLRDFDGKVVVLNFWASWCGPCREEAPELEATWQAYRLRGVQFLGVNHQDGRAAAMAFQREFGITYPSVFDPQGTLASRYGLIGLPTTFVVGSDGRIAYRFLGKVDASMLRSVLDDMLG